MDNNDYRKTEAEVDLEREKFEWYKEQYERERDEAQQKSVKQAEDERKAGIIALIFTGVLMLGPLIAWGICELVMWIKEKIDDHKQRGEKPKKRKKGEDPTYNEETNTWEYDN